MKWIPNFFTQLWITFRTAVKTFIAENYIRYSASLSYYTIFSLAPLLIITISSMTSAANDAITIINRVCDIYFPSAFTPNGDGKNDLFKVLNAFNLQEYNLTVYNRWGQRIFQTKNYANGWDGTLNGKLQDTGVYIWMCRFKKNNIESHMKGILVLIR